MGTSILSLLLLAIPTLLDAKPVTSRATAAAGTGKRGVAFEKDFVVPFFGLSWGYDWNRLQDSTMIPGVFEYTPMYKGPEFTQDFNRKYPRATQPGGLGPNVQHLLAFNEPDQCGENSGGVCIQNIPAAVAAHRELIQPIADANPEVKISAPAVTSSLQPDAITGMAKGLAYITEFMQQADAQNLRIDFMVAHWYGPWPADDAGRKENFEQFMGHMETIYNAGGGKRPLWITEFGLYAGATEEDQVSFLEWVMPWLDQQEWIQRYSYHFASSGFLVNDKWNGLSSVGQKYVSYVNTVDPSHCLNPQRVQQTQPLTSP